MTRRARPAIAALAVVALVGIPVWATVSHAAAPDERPSLGPVPDGRQLLAAESPVPADATRSAALAPVPTSADPASVPTSAVTDLRNTAGSNTAGSNTVGSAPAVATSPPAPVATEIGDALTVTPAGSTGRAAATPPPVVDATSVTRAPNPAPTPGAAPTTDAPPATEPAPTTTVAPIQDAGVGTAPTAGRMVLPNPGPLSPNQIDRITLTATPTALRDLLTVKVVFLGAGNTVLSSSSFSIRFVGREPRTQSFDATVPNGTVTLSISWTSVAAPISVDQVNVSVVGVAPPGSGI